MPFDNNDQSAPQFLEPELHFLHEGGSAGEPGSNPNSEDTVSLVQLVRKKDILADFPNYVRLKNKGFLPSPLEAGENVILDAEAHRLIADATGYPRIRFIDQGDDPPLLQITIQPFVKISHNRMQANLVLQPQPGGAPPLPAASLDAIVAEAGVIAGINQQAMDKARWIIDHGCDDFEEILIASGSFPGEGKDAEVHFELEIGPLAGHLLDDGTIDFRDRRIMVGVSAGQHIATKIPAVQGEPGYNVLGVEIEPKSGRDITIKVSGEAQFLPRENRVIATSDGAMSVVNFNTINVAAKTVIKGDVDYSTGNIASEGSVAIQGDIHPGFTVEVGGDLKIGGAVSGAQIQSGGNLVITGGITGKSTTIGAGGDININFIERGTVKSGGLVVVRKQCYYSSVEAATDIRCHRQSTILGGRILASSSLSVGNVGTENCTPAVLGAGIDPGRYLLYGQLKKEYSKQQEEIIQALQLHGKGGRPKKIRRMEETAEATKMQLLTLNLIPGTGLYSRIGQGNNREELEEEDPLYLQGVNIENVRIEVHGMIYAGTTLLLGNRSITLSQNIEKRKYRLSKNLKRIMALPL
ncbi:MAG: DUF342 domain-containing protein [Desulfopila sp.]